MVNGSRRAAVYEVCAVKDRAMDAFHRPMFVPHRNMAVREFAKEINNEQSPMYGHAEDYDLFFLGAWDEATAEFVCGQPELIQLGRSCVKPKEA